MYRNTRFGEILKGLSRGSFERMAEGRQANKYTKGFSSWNHLVAMMYAQVSGCRSLRELETGFNSQVNKHYHLGCQEIKRSTLSDANRSRDAGLFVDLCQHLIGYVNRKQRQELKTFVYLLDSTSITLKGLGYEEWTAEGSTRNTQGVKLHVLLSAETALPQYCNMTKANVNDISDAGHIAIEEHAIYAFDKGYCDYNWWNKIDQNQAKFVTRFKTNAALRVVSSRAIPTDARKVVLGDEIVKFQNKHPGGKRINHYVNPLRRIVIVRPDHPTPLVLATNDLDSAAQDIAETYKKRWLIELFFKWIKQNLKIKAFLGRSENAVRIQLYSAIICYLLIALYRHTHGMTASMKEVLVLIKVTLFQSPETEQYLRKKQIKIAQQQAAQRQLCLL